MKRYIRQAIALIVLILITTSSGVAAAATAVDTDTRPTVALVLGGGAARGLSHIGLIKAFEEHGIPIDMLVGASMGSIVSGFYATGYSVSNMEQVVANLDTASLINIGFPPKGGLIDSARLQKYLDVLLHGKEFSELETPFYSVIIDVRTGEEIALNSGLVSTGVLASMAIPGLFPPVEIDGRHFVDGGVKNNVPANVAKDLGADVIIAVDVKRELEEIDYDSILNNLELTLGVMMDGYVQLNIEDADVIIVPEVMFDSYMDFQKAAHFIEQGYRSGLAYVDQVKEAILAHDRDFQFTPYSQEGYSPEELAQILKRAERVVNNIPGPFTVKPELLFHEDLLPRIGVRANGGKLAWLNLGYRYGLDPEEGGHEGFVGWSKPTLGSVEIQARKSPDYNKLTWVFTAEAPIGDAKLQAEYLTQGRTTWKIVAKNSAIIETPHFTAGVSLDLERRRDPDTATYIGFEPLLKALPTTEYFPMLGIALARPYVYLGLDAETNIRQWNPTVSYQAGVGSEFQLFGLYPVDLSIGFEKSANTDAKLRIGIAGGSF